MRTAQESRAVDHVGFALFNRLNQLADILRIVFQVGILNHDDLAAGLGKSPS